MYGLENEGKCIESLKREKRLMWSVCDSVLLLMLMCLEDEDEKRKVRKPYIVDFKEIGIVFTLFEESAINNCRCHSFSFLVKCHNISLLFCLAEPSQQPCHFIQKRRKFVRWDVMRTCHIHNQEKNWSQF